MTINKACESNLKGFFFLFLFFALFGWPLVSLVVNKEAMALDSAALARKAEQLIRELQESEDVIDINDIVHEYETTIDNQKKQIDNLVQWLAAHAPNDAWKTVRSYLHLVVPCLLLQTIPNPHACQAHWFSFLPSFPLLLFSLCVFEPNTVIARVHARMHCRRSTSLIEKMQVTNQQRSRVSQQTEYTHAHKTTRTHINTQT